VENSINTEKRALIVDLDGTFIKSDLLVESFLKLLKLNFLKAVKSLLYIPKGLSNFKNYIAKEVDLNIESIPKNKEVLDLIKTRDSYLVTASNEKYAKQIHQSTNIFIKSFGSSSDLNLKGKNKLIFLKKEFTEFDYIGDSKADFPILLESNTAFTVNYNPKLVKKLNSQRKNLGKSEVVELKKRENFFLNILKALRVYQWPKNLLVFLPILMAHELGDSKKLLATFFAFICFCITASSIYLLNDLLDLDSDRVHSSKSKRVIAAGDISVFFSLMLASCLGVSSLILSLFLGLDFTFFILIYFLFNFFYSLFLKKVVILDIILLSSFYGLRILSGGAATETPISPWLLVFSLFFFFSLASMKRLSEVLKLQQIKETKAKGRGYLVSDISLLENFSITSSFLAVLVFSLYLNSKNVLKIYDNHQYLWFILPLILYFLLRLVIQTKRGNLKEDPVLYTLKDKLSYVICFLILIIIFMAK